jgi:hypothetical protein
MPPKGACFGAGAATPLAIEAAVGVCRPKRAAKGARTDERVATGVFVDLELLDLVGFGRPKGSRRGGELELEAGPDGPLEDAAVSILVACRVDAARLMTGLGFWWSNTGS